MKKMTVYAAILALIMSGCRLGQNPETIATYDATVTHPVSRPTKTRLSDASIAMTIVLIAAGVTSVYAIMLID